MMDRNYKVAIVVLNWNGLSDTLSCLESLVKLAYTSYKIIVVDNDSSEPIHQIKDLYSDVVLIKNDSNLGYTGGNNVGIKHAISNGAEYIWILNNDTIVEKDSLAILVEYLDQHPQVGAVSNLILYMDNQTCWYNGGIIKKGKVQHIDMGLDVRELSTTKGIDFISGCSFLARSEILNMLKGFDDQYFCYCEDLDISARIRQHGYELGYIDKAIVRHKVSASTGHISETKIYYKYRNMVYYLNKYNFKKSVLVGFYMKSLKYVLSLLVKYKSPGLSLTLLTALVDGNNNKMGIRQRK